MTEISAEVPMREMHSFTMYLKQVTRGMGSFTFDFLRYEQLPANLVAEVITESIQEEMKYKNCENLTGFCSFIVAIKKIK